MTVHRSQVMYDGSAKSSMAYGLTVFGGVMLCIVGAFQMLQGITAIAEDDLYVPGIDYAYALTVQQWGWLQLIVGLLALGTGGAVLLGKVWGYALGIVTASLGAIMNFAFLPHYPLWSVVVIAFDVLVVWGLCTQMARSGASDRR